MKSFEDKLKEIEEKEAQLKAQKKALKARASQEERKARTKRLINAGGAIEAKMKDLTGKEEYPAEGENLETILDLIREGYEKTEKTEFRSRQEEDGLSRDRQAQIGRICEEILGRSFDQDDLRKFRDFMTYQYDHGYYPRQMNR